jgi:cellobiose phosphorylase
MEYESARRLRSESGLQFEFNANGSVRRIDSGNVVLNLFPGNEVEGGVANVFLRLQDASGMQAVPLLGPCSPSAFAIDARGFTAAGEWRGIRYRLALALADAAPAWFWHVALENATDAPLTVDLVYVQDLALSSYAAIRLNECYVSHYVDHSPLAHVERGWAIASRQNLATGARHPWTLIGSLRRGVAFATDALDVYGLAARAGRPPAGIVAGLPAVRLQHEHSMVAIQDAPLVLAAGMSAVAGFFGWLEMHHPGATDASDLALVDRACTLPEALIEPRAFSGGRVAVQTLFAPARLLPALDLDRAQIDAHFGAQRRHEEREGDTLLSFFAGERTHVVLRAKELVVLRPHGQILRTGRSLIVDETALTSTVWMAGVFHSMLTQGHVSINRLLSTVRSYLGLFRSHGQRVFVEIDGHWHLLDVPSAFEMSADVCRWIYRHEGGAIEVRSEARHGGPGVPHAFGLTIRVLAGAPARFLICHHVAVGGDDGNRAAPPRFDVDSGGVFISLAADSELGRRFPNGGFRIAPDAGTEFERVDGDAVLFADGRSRGEPFVCIVTRPAMSIGVAIRGELVLAREAPPVSAPLALPRIDAEDAAAVRLGDIVPWYADNALIHYLAPRGLEQYSGGGWGTRDVCQGPVEMLLALGRAEPVRDLLVRVFAAQNPDGDWPQWFTFFERQREIRAADSHGDIVFWPLLALARYLIATEDAQFLEARVPFFQAEGGARPEIATIWQHVERALAVISARTVAGTRLAAYGHGDWNDALQPADPRLRERMCSAWTVTLHRQTLAALADALRRIGRGDDAMPLERDEAAVRQNFQSLLMPDGVIAGYALFAHDGCIDYLLHPRDRHTGVRYGLLAMIHAIIADMLEPAQARAHLELVERHLLGPDGARLFDRPLPYRGGPQHFFLRAEAASFFGREIGLMYTHAHLRYAEALAHIGEADRFFEALGRANPIGISQLVPLANRRQANCYYSSSDAAFRDRYEASESYERVATGTVALEGGWRMYSSGPGIALSLVVGSLLGVRQEGSRLVIDPVLPRSLDGLRVAMPVGGRPIEIVYQVGRSGCGPVSVMLNDAPLAFARRANRYREGGAEIRWRDFFAHLSGQRDRLTVTLR